MGEPYIDDLRLVYRRSSRRRIVKGWADSQSRDRGAITGAVLLDSARARGGYISSAQQGVAAPSGRITLCHQTLLHIHMDASWNTVSLFLFLPETLWMCRASMLGQYVAQSAAEK